MFLRIVNPGVCPVEGFTILGVSSSKGKEELIGQFGSGNKHAINVCLRHGINPIIYCDTTRVMFYTQPEKMGDTYYNRVYCKVSNRKPDALSIAAEYGEQDWQSINMALREFVSNAIDAAGGSAKGVKVDIVDKITARPGKTVIGIPLTPEVQQWFNALPFIFRHFDKQADLTKKILSKPKPNKGCFYRKNVLIRTTKETEPALFDYNFGDELRIDESRNLSDYSLREAVAELLCKSSELEDVFRLLPTKTNFWERSLSECDLNWGARDNKDHWIKTWIKVYGGAVISLENNPLVERAQKQGYQVIIIPDAGWYLALFQAGVKTVLQVLDNVNDKGHTLKDATPDVQAIYDSVWDWIELVELTEGKEKPPVKIYEEIMKAESETCGYCQDGTVFLKEGFATNRQTMLEEFAHYITGSTDMSRDFQDFAFRGWAKTAIFAGG